MAALQIIVYAGAVVVLFIFVIMMIGPTPVAAGEDLSLITKTMGITMMGILGGGIAFALLGFQPAQPGIAACAPGTGPECAQFGGVVAVACELYVQVVVPFELILVLLLVAIVGAIAVARGRNAAEAAKGPHGTNAPKAASALGDGN
jgi:NADH-quinone oxidoreductase subunit J